MKESQPLGLIIGPIAKAPSEGLFNISSRIQKDPPAPATPKIFDKYWA